jgi:hypothetical protein
MNAVREHRKSSTPSLPEGFLFRWILFCGMAEFLGIALAAILMVLGLGWEDQLPNLPVWLFPFFLALVSGSIEGAIVGRLQWTVLREIYPRIRVYAWMRVTILAAVIAWLLGLLPSILLSASGAEVSEPSRALMIGMGALTGLFLGALFGFFQSFILRQIVRRSYLWILANALGWMVGMALIFTAASWVREGWPIALIGWVAGVSGLLAGFSVGIATGMVFPRLPIRSRERPG